ncbi:SPOR domain-containing protein [Halomonas sp. HP20-15]|uniref:SPOR domain-containing protein n=1 Tax=Halomonas sp. HP20-15 TaxID=3085901 RepID=UPI00298223DF|nr:SPOR domain-containing protein [Halomonas sp. HP20-15]MDW5377088.1 SPOR domain-containing protein [Halomonas sp. HP20-15]
MKYGMRERVSGAVILLALGVIFIPMLFDDPPSREDRPEPVLTIEQPIDVKQTPVEAPEPPASLGQIQSPQAPSQPAGQAQPDATQATEPDDAESAGNTAEQVAGNPSSPAGTADASRPDPIAELAQRAGQGGQPSPQGESSKPATGEGAAKSATTSAPAVAENGNWAVQVGSFGKPDNAARLEKQLDEQGFEAYSRPRDNNLTTVYVGPFASSDDGEKARTALKEQVNIQGLLIRVQEGE